MEVTCDQCRTKLNVPDDKIPKNQLVRLNCPKCKNKISIDTRDDEGKDENGSADNFSETGRMHLKFIESQKGEQKEENHYSYDDYSGDQSLSFFEENASLALVMPRDEGQGEVIRPAVEELGYKYVASSNTRDALGKLRYHQFDLILLSDGFDNQGLEGNSIINYLNHISISIRRKTFLALIGDNFKSMDDMMAFALSVNMVINTGDIPKAAVILKRGIAESQIFYKIYMDTLVEVGKA